MRAWAVRARHFVIMAAVVATMLSRVSAANADASRSLPVPRPSRLFLGADVGFLVPGPVSIDGKRVAGEGGNLYFGLQTGYSHALSHRIGVLGLTRIGGWKTALAEARDEQRYRVDLALGPELRGENANDGWHVSAPLGVTIAQSQAGTTGRAVRDSYGPGRGVNFGLTGGFHLPGPRSRGGAYFDLSWITHITWIDHTAKLTSSGAAIAESYAYVDHMLVLSVGGLLRL